MFFNKSVKILTTILRVVNTRNLNSQLIISVCGIYIRGIEMSLKDTSISLAYIPHYRPTLVVLEVVVGNTLHNFSC